MRIAILGSTGMLGGQLLAYFLKTNLEVTSITRQDIDAQNTTIQNLKHCLESFDYVINCIGIIKPYIHDDNAYEVQRAIEVNALFPHMLATAFHNTPTKLINIATDCVYDGVSGNYDENALHNCIDVYGKSKSLGEVQAGNVINLRCSVIGFEKKSKLSLLEWFLGQKNNSEISGYANHFWNGLSALAFAKICHGIIKNNLEIAPIQHIIPKNILSKSQMLHLFNDHFNKACTIKNINTPIAINRSLSTIDTSTNEKLWNCAGYEKIPTIEELIEEMVLHPY